MDKRIVDKLIELGFITKVGVNADMYKDVDDLIACGVITMPGIKDKIMELLGDTVEQADETPTIVEDLNNPALVIDETPTTTEPIVDTPAEETPIVDTPTEDVETIVCDDPADVEVTVVEEVETPKKTKKSKKTDGVETSDDIIVDDNQ